jgi:hypothetical protein
MLRINSAKGTNNSVSDEPADSLRSIQRKCTSFEIMRLQKTLASLDGADQKDFVAMMRTNIAGGSDHHPTEDLG